MYENCCDEQIEGNCKMTYLSNGPISMHRKTLTSKVTNFNSEYQINEAKQPNRSKKKKKKLNANYSARRKKTTTHVWSLYLEARFLITEDKKLETITT